MCTEGKVLPFPPVRKATTGEMVEVPPIDCPDCGGSGKLEVEPDWEETGNKLNEQRISAGITLRSFCIDNELDPVKVSKIERGLIECPAEVKAIYNTL